MRLPTPLPQGVTTVEAVDLFEARDRSGSPQSAPVELLDGNWEVDTLSVDAGRWWATVRASKGGTPYSYPLRDPIDLPEDDRLVVSPEALATSMSIPLPIDDQTRDLLTQAIIDAQADVTAYLGRPALTPTSRTESGLYDWGDEWSFSELGDDDLIRVTSVTPDADGSFTVTYLCGIDARTGVETEPIRRYIRAHAANSPEATRHWHSIVKPTGAIKSASTQGQSVSYDKATLGGGGTSGSGAPGSLPTLGSLDRWRLAGRNAYQSRTRFGTRYGV